MQTLLAWGACVIPTRWSAKQKSKGTQKIRNEKHQLLFLLLPPLQNESRTVHCNRSSLISFFTFFFLSCKKGKFFFAERHGTRPLTGHNINGTQMCVHIVHLFTRDFLFRIIILLFFLGCCCRGFIQYLLFYYYYSVELSFRGNNALWGFPCP